MYKRILSIFIIFVALNLFAAENVLVDLIYWDYTYWSSECSLNKEHRISALCGFFDKSNVYRAETTMVKCKEEIEILKKEHNVDFEIGKKSKDFYRVYAAENGYTVFDWDALTKSSKEKLEKFIEETEKSKSGLQHFLDKEIEKSEIGGVINKKRAYDIAKQIIKYDDQIEEAGFYFLYARARAKLEKEEPE